MPNEGRIRDETIKPPTDQWTANVYSAGRKKTNQRSKTVMFRVTVSSDEIQWNGSFGGALRLECCAWGMKMVGEQPGR